MDGLHTLQYLYPIIYNEVVSSIPRTTTETNNYYSEKITENVSEIVEFTYADSWAVTVYNDTTYLNIKNKQRENLPLSKSVVGPTTETQEQQTDTSVITTTKETTVTTTTVTNKYKSGETKLKK